MQLKEKLVALAYTAGWMTASSGLILLNKYILSTLKFHYPLTLSRCAARRGAERAQALRENIARVRTRCAAWRTPPRGRCRHARQLQRPCAAGRPLTRRVRG